MDSAFGKAYIPLDDVNVPVSIARGVAIFDASIDRIYNDVFGKADHAMYMNKEEMKSFLTMENPSTVRMIRSFLQASGF